MNFFGHTAKLLLLTSCIQCVLHIMHGVLRIVSYDLHPFGNLLSKQQLQIHM